jgi:hypothetical protein
MVEFWLCVRDCYNLTTMAQGRVSVLSRAGFLMLAVGPLFGCASEAPISDGADPVASEDDDATEAEDAAGAPPTCEVPEYPDESERVPFERLEARVVDPDGAPVAGTMAQTCGINLCLVGTTDSAGRVLHVDDQEMQLPAFKYGDGIRHAQFALVLGAGPEHDLGDQITVALPAIDTAERFRPGATLRSGDVELELHPDTHIAIVEFEVSEEERVFLASEFPPDRFPAAARDQDFVALFGLGPVKTKLCPPGRLRLPNNQGLAPGARVTLFAHGTDVSVEFAPYGGWAEVSTATVSEDGAFIETDPDQGLPFISVIGVR